jgi:hypothetical protein
MNADRPDVQRSLISRCAESAGADQPGRWLGRFAPAPVLAMLGCKVSLSCAVGDHRISWPDRSR